MTERFNFYDVYGYLVPGLSLTIVIWVPFSLVLRTWPSTELASVAAAVAVAYILGHYLQTIAKNALPSTEGKFHPSTILLNKSCSRFSHELKGKIEKRVRSWFELEVAIEQDADDKIDKVREDAFFECRRIVNLSSPYPEQHQGMYNLMRGLVISFGLGVTYNAGWAISSWRAPWLDHVASLILEVGLAASISFAFVRLNRESRISLRSADLLSFWSMLAMAGGGGCLLGLRFRPSPDTAYLLSFLAAVYLTATLRFYSSYPYFAWEFAKSVWRNFAAEPIERPARSD